MVVVVKDDNIRIERLELGPYSTNAYIVVCPKTQESVLIDAPAEAEAIMDSLRGTNAKYILMTHSHGDHTGALVELQARLKVPVAAHTLDAGNLPLSPGMLLDDGDTVLVGDLSLTVIHTPGHTPGSLCFRAGRYLISGDTIFPGGPGNTRSAAAFRQIVKSITGKIFALPDDTVLYPGHGESTVLKKEKDELAVFSSRSHRDGLCGDVRWLAD
ncbi:MAG: MBL fold metallo-hydrolase [Chloroflexi bacterium]|nr:MBL fold metallo-hydrolase [Chloroflexota bacterium]